MSFIGFNYWHTKEQKWKPTGYNADTQIARIEPCGNYTRIWLNGQDYPGLITDLTWVEATTAFAFSPPGDAPVEPPPAEVVMP